MMIEERTNRACLINCVNDEVVVVVTDAAVDFGRVLFRNNFPGDRGRTTTAEPVIIAGGAFCGCAWTVVPVEKLVRERIKGSFRLVLLVLTLRSDEGGAGVCELVNNDDFDRGELFIFVGSVLAISLERSSRKVTLFTIEDSQSSSCCFFGDAGF